MSSDIYLEKANELVETLEMTYEDNEPYYSVIFGGKKSQQESDDINILIRQQTLKKLLKIIPELSPDDANSVMERILKLCHSK